MTKKGLMIGLAIVSVSLLATAVLYPSLPAQVPTHWNIHGQIDHYGPKWTLLVAGPGILAATLGILAVIPWLSPRNFKVDTFRSTYVYIVLAVLVCLAYIQGLMLWAAWEGQVDITKATWGGICLLFAIMGNVMGKVRRNFWVGVRTPWTLASERVWYATHRLAGKTMVLGALASFVLRYANTEFWIPIAAILLGGLIPAVYSLVYYKQLERRREI